MDKLAISLKEGVYSIYSADINLDPLWIGSEDKRDGMLFEKESEHTYSIKAQDIAAVLGSFPKEKATIYFGENSTKLSVEKDFQFFALTSLMSSVQTANNENKEIYLYVGLDGVIRFMWNQKPSSKCFYRSATPIHLEKDDEQTVQLSVEIITKYLPLSRAYLIVSYRSNKKETKMECSLKSSVYLGNNLYRTFAVGKFKPVKLTASLDSAITLEEYDTSLFDIKLSIETKELSLTGFKFRLPYNDLLENETAVPFSEKDTLLLSWYATKGNHNLSFRAVYLSNESYNIYNKEKERVVSNEEPQKEKEIVLIGERSDKAQDNGYHFFKYLMNEKATDVTAYYVISKDSKDHDNVKPYLENVVYYKSAKHIELFFQASAIAHTHDSNFLLPIVTAFTKKRKMKIKKLFLQHGVNSVRDIEYIYGKKSNPTFTNAFLVSSEREYEIVKKELGYSDSEIFITGLSRFDSLLRKNNANHLHDPKRSLLIMPSWRLNEDKLSDNDFKKKLFFKYISELIQDFTLKTLYESHDLSIHLYLHTNFQKYNHLFHSEFVSIVPEGKVSVQELLRSHDILITDYSSVALDFALLRRPVLYYQFDGDLSEGRKRDTSFFLPGPIFKDKEKLMVELSRKITKKENELDEEFTSLLEETIYMYSDLKANDRIYSVLKTLLKQY